MRLLPALLAAALLVLPGCLESEAERVRGEMRGLEGQLDEARLQADQARWRAEALAAQVRAEQDLASRLLNQTVAESDALRTRLEATAGELEAAEARVRGAEERLADAEPLQGTTAELRAAQAELAQLRERHESLLNQTHRSLTSVRNANFTWRFTDLRGDTRAWAYPMEAYRQHVKAARSLDMLHMQTAGGRHVLAPDPRPYVDPAPFAANVRDLTEGRSDRDFVREALNLKRQLVIYEFALVDVKGYYKWPVETLAEGTGVCGDTVILLASLLLAGSAAADYGMSVAVWAVKYDLSLGRMVASPEDVNHAILEVTFRDGERWLVETTALDLTLYADAPGWRFPIEA